MHPTATVADLPSTHNVMTYIHNLFIKLIKDIKAEMQVRFFI
jgi:hypothetical protein